MAFKFVHAADVHLNSPLRSLALRNADLAELIGDASRQVLMNIVDLCLNEKVDALLLAGDLYDGDQTSMKTARFLAAQIRRLDEAGIRVFIIRGNHDAISRITRELTLPESVTTFGGRADAVSLERERGALPVVVHGLSFSQPHAPESLLPKYRAPVSDAVNIGLMHTSLEGAVGHDPYAPCSLADLAVSGFDYWALGHIHKRAEHQGKPGSTPCVIMAGIPQGRDINEGGTKSVTLVTINDDRSITLEERPVSVAEFVRVPVDDAGRRGLAGSRPENGERPRGGAPAGRVGSSRKSPRPHRRNASVMAPSAGRRPAEGRSRRSCGRHRPHLDRSDRGRLPPTSCRRLFMHR